MFVNVTFNPLLASSLIPLAISEVVSGVCVSYNLNWSDSDIGNRAGVAVLWLSSVSATVLVTSACDERANVWAIRPPPTPPATLSALSTSSLDPSPHAQVYWIIAPLVLDVVFSKYTVSPSFQYVIALRPVRESYAVNETIGSPVKIAI